MTREAIFIKQLQVGVQAAKLRLEYAQGNLRFAQKDLQKQKNLLAKWKKKYRREK